MNDTHRPDLTSWVESANAPDADFPVQNLPYGIFRRRESDELPRVGVAIGDRILDVEAALEEGVFGIDTPARTAAEACGAPWLNGLMALGPEYAGALRARLSELLRADAPEHAADPTIAERLLVAQREAELFVPAEIGDYTDFYASVHHATNVGSMFRPDNPLLPNYKHVPIGYHGRASSIVVSGTPVRRPAGQLKGAGDEAPTFAATRMLDFECEVGFYVGEGNVQGEPVAIADAERHLFGVGLVNDWSARDVQAWEYQPLGPFLAKNFATTVSPWVVTMEALAPFRVPAAPRPAGDPAPLPYLWSDDDQARGGIALTLDVLIASRRMREEGVAPARVSRASFTAMYWTPAQLLAHHASGGCNLRPGDLLASGTVSGPERDARGCLLELTWRGTEPLTLPTGETRKFLEDGDEVTLRGFCERAGARRIGLGACRGEVSEAR